MSKDKEYRLIPYDSDDHSDHIAISDIFSTVWDARRTILIITLAFALYGVIRSLAASEEFTSSVSMMPNAEQQMQMPSMLQQFSGLLGSAGGMQQTDQLSIQLYPDIIYSTPSMHHLIHQDIHIPSTGNIVTVMEYMQEYRERSTVSRVSGGLLTYTVHLPVTIIKGILRIPGYFRDSSSQDPAGGQMLQIQESEYLTGQVTGRTRLTLDEYLFIEEMKDRILTDYRPETGLFSVEVSMPDPEISAQLTESIVEYLIDYITGYRTEKLVRNLDFVTERYDEARREFEEAQDMLAEFRDRNINISTARLMTEEQRLESQYQLKFDIYHGMAQRWEDARIRLEEETPVFNILEPVSVPSSRSSPRRTLMVILFSLFGGVVSLFWIYIRGVFYRNSEPGADREGE